MKGRIFFLILLMSLSAASASCMANEFDPLVLRVNASEKSIDIYFVNDGRDDISVYPLMRYYGSSRELQLVFFQEKNLCKTCTYTEDLEVPFQMPPSATSVTLRPGQITGTRLSIKAVARRYKLKRGCYGFYAVYEHKEQTNTTEVFRGKKISNSDAFCLAD